MLVNQLLQWLIIKRGSSAMCFSLLYSRFVFQDGEVTDDKYQDDIGALEAREQILQEVLSGPQRVLGLQQLQPKTYRVPGLQGRKK